MSASAAAPPPSSSCWTLQGKTILVTGGSKGIGAAVVDEALARSASTVIFCSRSAVPTDQLEEKRAQFPASQLHHVVCDVSTPEGRTTLVETVKNDLGVTALHGLVNNVGINIRKPMEEQSAEEYHSILRTNLDSAYFLCQQLRPLLEHHRDNSSSSIVNVSSAAGVQSSGTGVAYGMSKAALNQMTRGLACEWGGRKNIRVNAVTPWMTMTPLLEAAIASNPSQLDKVQAWTPLHRLADAKEIAAPIIFLLMPASSYITGQVLGVDGGLTAQGFDGPCVTPQEP